MAPLAGRLVPWLASEHANRVAGSATASSIWRSRRPRVPPTSKALHGGWRIRVEVLHAAPQPPVVT